MIIDSLHCQTVVDRTHEPLGPGWLRRAPTLPEQREQVSSHVWRTGANLQFRDTLVQAIEQASEHVLLCSFLLADTPLADALIQASERGVRVYILTASEQRLDSLIRDEDDFGKRMVEQHKALLARLAGKVRLRSAEHVHAKFLVIDALAHKAPRAWLSTANLNKALQESIELGVQLEENNARALAECFNWAFWCEARRELHGANRLVEIKGPPAVPRRPGHDQVLATLQGSFDLREAVITMIRSAQYEILASSYGLDADHIVIDELILAANRGVRVSLLTRPRPAVANAVAKLAAAGIQVLAHDKLHAKALVADGEALVMTANFDAFGLDEGFEVGVKLAPEPAAAVERSLREWIACFPWMYRANATRGEHLGDFCPADKGVRDGIVRVVDYLEQKLADVEAHDALSLESTPGPQVQPTDAPGELAQKVGLVWNVKAPRLPQGATEIKPPHKGESKTAGLVSQPSTVPVYQHKGAKYIVVGRTQEQERVRDLAQQLGARLVLERV
ncbi:phosphatidylserine/phosphatidylglycerophosphate/cardiolipin synthase family protein [Pseudomonas nabeulensis]|uniref:phospholipase D n=1 Tax=Pseudomonas nabeulensis TaxID=2293833 RepID=A0A4Z0B5E3_9PSED|nr:phosphatidylserine/phosphatidylglycerophosphate/cardiolipin synthase family protein [Pseudomonas nabeulensis]TFY93767.1 phosphatidylserine/phosphatidylglycerophosphate/cardiolipin synthase family protein [Pseudomonas nabeulensis]